MRKCTSTACSGRSLTTISDHWPAHLAIIGEFWARVTGGPSRYVRSNAGVAHFSLNLEPRHFVAWLQLSDANCRCYLRPREAQAISRVAHDIGTRLSNILSVGRSGTAAGLGAFLRTFHIFSGLFHAPRSDFRTNRFHLPHKAVFEMHL
jgi:hypothetical protein